MDNSCDKVCCFFGHHDTSADMKDVLEKQVFLLIENENICKFYVGTHGSFDCMVINILRKAKEKFPHISYEVVLAYMPNGSPDEYSYIKPDETIYPDGLENIPRKFAILWRNDWMLNQSSVVVCYVKHHLGGAGKMIEKAIKQNKKVINLAV